MKKFSILFLCNLLVFLLFNNLFLFFALLWFLFGFFVGHYEIKATFKDHAPRNKTADFYMCLISGLMGIFALLIIQDFEDFKNSLPFKLPKIRNPFYYED